MKILIELPDGWLDSDLTGNLDWITKTVRQEVATQITKALVEKGLKELPELHFERELIRQEVKKRLVDSIAENITNNFLRSMQ